MPPHFPRPLVISLATIAACSGGNDDNGDTDRGAFDLDGFDVLVSTTAVAEGDATCPDGGVLVNTGFDNGADGGTEGDGILQDGEVTSTTAICADEDGIVPGTVGVPGGTLLRYEGIPAGEDGCVEGGVRIHVGEDDGTPGGTATDGQLQDEEIDNTTILCTDDPFDFVPGPDAPGGTAGTAVIDLSGGATLNDQQEGGQGGNLDVYLYQDGPAFLRGHTTGTPDTTFTPPTASINFGSQKLTISSDATLGQGDTDDIDELSDGDFFYDGDYIYVVDGDQAIEVTGLEVQAGATLTIEPPPSVIIIDEQPSAAVAEVAVAVISRTLRFDNAFVVAGRVEFSDDAKGSSLNVTAGVIDIPGTIDVSAPAGGGSISLQAGNGLIGFGRIAGTLDARATGTDAEGNGGNISVYAYGTLLVSGDLLADGAGEANGGNIYTLGYSGLFMDGTASFNGGTGEVDGGAGGSFTMAGGKVVFNGTATGRGGDAPASCPTDFVCEGANGGSVDAQSGELGGMAIAGSFDLSGGDGAENGLGGNGGNGSFTMYSGSGGFNVVTRSSSGTLEFGASFLAPGGASGAKGGEGGNGGSLNVAAQYNTNATGGVSLLGIAEARLDGGDGAEGGWGGDAEVYNESYGNGALDAAFPTGLAWDIPLLNRGGNGTVGEGGEGGMSTFEMETNSSTNRSLWLRGDIDQTGGTGPFEGGEGGQLTANTSNGDLWHTGTFLGNGGDASNANASAGAEGALVFFGAEGGTLTLDGTLEVNGSEGSEGGHGGLVWAEGTVIESAGSCTLDGGDAIATSFEGDGGEGGVGIFRSTGGISTLTGSITGVGGSGSAGGDDGDDATISLDGIPL